MPAHAMVLQRQPAAHCRPAGLLHGVTFENPERICPLSCASHWYAALPKMRPCAHKKIRYRKRALWQSRAELGSHKKSDSWGGSRRGLFSNARVLVTLCLRGDLRAPRALMSVSRIGRGAERRRAAGRCRRQRASVVRCRAAGGSAGRSAGSVGGLRVLRGVRAGGRGGADRAPLYR
jgi:hypothetical protein